MPTTLVRWGQPSVLAKVLQMPIVVQLLSPVPPTRPLIYPLDFLLAPKLQDPKESSAHPSRIFRGLSNGPALFVARLVWKVSGEAILDPFFIARNSDLAFGIQTLPITTTTLS